MVSTSEKPMLRDAAPLSPDGLPPAGMQGGGDRHPDLEAVLPFMLNKVVRQLNAGLDRALAGRRLSTPQWRVLATLAWTDYRRPGEIADFTSIEASTLSRMLDRLIEAGLVTRRKLPESGRASEIALTAAGEATLATARSIVEAEQHELLGRLNPQEAVELMRILRKLYRPKSPLSADQGDQS